MRIIFDGLNNPIYIGEYILQQNNFWHDILPPTKILIVTDEIIAKLYLPQLLLALDKHNINTLILNSGEQHKTWDSVTKIIATLAQHKYDRSSTLISFGGGVIGDLSGFAAAIFMRGINWVQIPTTLLAQIDSSLGGKTACNFLGYKNLIGTFYNPSAVITDFSLLKSLPHREYAAGLAEVVKYGMACDSNFFYWLEDNIQLLVKKNSTVLATAIEKCCAIKLAIVKQDEKDLGIRRALNFGHTFAHALEAATNFQHYLHGEAVAIGMLLATRLAVRMGLIGQELLQRLYKLLNCLGLPTNWAETHLEVSMIYNYMLTDKKAHEGQISLILPYALGAVKVIQGLELKYLEEIIQENAST